MKKQKETIGYVLQESGLSANPGYYTGRGVYSDINANILCTVSKNIRKYIGQKEQEVFNQMVLDIPTLKASFFVELTIRLQLIGIENGWWWDKEKVLNWYYKDLLPMPICEHTERIKQEFKKLMKL